jgi:hypothetical protein
VKIICGALAGIYELAHCVYLPTPEISRDAFVFNGIFKYSVKKAKNGQPTHREI